VIAGAVVFLVAVFFIKNGIPFLRNKNIEAINQKSSLVGNATVADLINKDTDGDEIPDWEESLWGTDPNTKETTPGVPDKTMIEKLKTDPANNYGGGDDGKNNTENLTETDKFSRELFSTLVTLNENGAVDQETVDKISNSLAESIQNSPQRKVYALSDIKVVPDGSVAAVKKYADASSAIYTKYPIQGNVLDILQRFVVDENNVDASVLSELDPIIKQTRARLAAMLTIQVPEPFSLLYVDLLNTSEKLAENLEDIRLYDTDAIVALGGITQYEQNVTAFQETLGKLVDAINQKLNN